MAGEPVLHPVGHRHATRVHGPPPAHPGARLAGGPGRRLDRRNPGVGHVAPAVPPRCRCGRGDDDAGRAVAGVAPPGRLRRHGRPRAARVRVHRAGRADQGLGRPHHPQRDPRRRLRPGPPRHGLGSQQRPLRPADDPRRALRAGRHLDRHPAHRRRRGAGRRPVRARPLLGTPQRAERLQGLLDRHVPRRGSGVLQRHRHPPRRADRRHRRRRRRERGPVHQRGVVELHPDGGRVQLRPQRGALRRRHRPRAPRHHPGPHPDVPPPLRATPVRQQRHLGGRDGRPVRLRGQVSG